MAIRLINSRIGTWNALDELFKRNGITHFTAREVARASKAYNVINVAPPSTTWLNIIPTLKVLETLRKGPLGGHPITVHSGYRSKAYNAAIGGATASQHMRFCAIDFSVEGYTPRQLAKMLEVILAGVGIGGGIGIYKNFVHMDTRKSKSRWNG
jgi:hypothetical protein